MCRKDDDFGPLQEIFLFGYIEQEPVFQIVVVKISRIGDRRDISILRYIEQTTSIPDCRCQSLTGVTSIGQ